MLRHGFCINMRHFLFYARIGEADRRKSRIRRGGAPPSHRPKRPASRIRRRQVSPYRSGRVLAHENAPPHSGPFGGALSCATPRATETPKTSAGFFTTTPHRGGSGRFHLLGDCVAGAQGCAPAMRPVRTRTGTSWMTSSPTAELPHPRGLFRACSGAQGCATRSWPVREADRYVMDDDYPHSGNRRGGAVREGGSAADPVGEPAELLEGDGLAWKASGLLSAAPGLRAA